MLCMIKWQKWCLSSVVKKAILIQGINLFYFYLSINHPYRAFKFLLPFWSGKPYEWLVSIFGGEWKADPVSVTKITLPKFISQKVMYLGPWNLVRAWMWMTQRSTMEVRVIRQRSRSSGQKMIFQVSFNSLTGDLVKGHWVKVKCHDPKVELKGQGQRSRST